jgi:hypothetical protein
MQFYGGDTGGFTAPQCVREGVLSVAIDAELTALGHVTEAIRRERKEDAAVARLVKRAFVIIQVDGRSNRWSNRGQTVVKPRAIRRDPPPSARLPG